MELDLQEYKAEAEKRLNELVIACEGYKKEVDNMQALCEEYEAVAKQASEHTRKLIEVMVKIEGTICTMHIFNFKKKLKVLLGYLTEAKHVS